MRFSTEMQEQLTGLEVVHDVWPDHSMLVGTFKHPRCCPPLWVWPMPEQMTWPKQFAEQICWPAQVEDMTAAYAQLWEAIETSATMNSPIAIPKRACGRASRTQPISVRTNASVKSYQLVKVVSGGRAPGKSSSLASPQLLVIEQFHFFVAVRLEKVQCFLLR